MGRSKSQACRPQFNRLFTCCGRVQNGTIWTRGSVVNFEANLMTSRFQHRPNNRSILLVQCGRVAKLRQSPVERIRRDRFVT